MKELRRILSDRRLLIGLALILLANGVLFIREQAKNDYGLALELPGGSFAFFDGSLTLTQEPVEARAAYRRYSEWLARMRKLPLADAVSLLSERKTALSERLTENSGDENDRLDYVAVNNLLAQTDYLTGYGSWLETIQQNKENLLTFSIFNDPGSFSGRNILKTAAEFEKLRGVELTLGADGAVEAWMTFRLTDYLLLAALLLIGVSFLEERKAGLWSVIHAAPRGRLRLALRRVAILFGASVFAVLLLYGTTLALGMSLYGGAEDLNRAVQSVPALGKLPVRATVGEFLLGFFLLRIGAAFLVSLLLWLMLSAVQNVKYTILAAAVLLAAEYSLYTFLPVQSALNLLKYFNLFSYISLSELYTNYLNIDIFSHPLGIRTVSQLALVPLCLLLAAICVWLHCRKKPAAGRDPFAGIAYRLNRLSDRLLCRLHPFGMELYKTFWLQKGVVLVGLLAYIALGLSYAATIPVTSLEELAARQYVAAFAGEITDDTFTRIDAEQAALEEARTAYQNAQLAYEQGNMEFSEFDRYARDASAAEIGGKGLATVRSRAEALRQLGEEQGFVPWLIDETPFESVYGARAQSRQHQAALIALLALTLLLAGSIPYERQAAVLLRATPRGRAALTLRKLLLAALTATLVWAIVFGRELYTLLSDFDISAWSAPAQNLSMLSAFPLSCSVAGWLLLLYACRWLCLFCCAILVLWLSAHLKRLEAAYLAASAAMLLPSLLSVYVGISALRPLSLILPIEAMPLLIGANGALTKLLPWVAALVGIAAIAALRLFRAPGRKRHLKFVSFKK